MSIEMKGSIIMASIAKINSGKLSTHFTHNVDDIKSSIHLSQYQRVVDLLNQNLTAEGELTVPNIITVTGERGSGKTSFVHSLREILDNNKVFSNSNTGLTLSVKHPLFLMDVIDPTKFSEKTNILEIILSSLMSSIPDNDSENPDKTDKTDVLKLIAKFQELMPTINDSVPDDKYVLERIVDMKEILKLNDTFREIVKLFLTLHLEENRNNKLVIILDDIDLKANYAYQMLEQIRRVMWVENVIIIMTTNMAQLEMVLWEKISHKYNNALKSEVVTPNDITEKVEKYIEKLMPISYRVNLPKIDKYSVLVENKSSLNNHIKALFFNNLGIDLPENSLGQPYPFDKMTLRSTIQLISLLNQFKKQKREQRLVKKNLDEFVNYLINDFAKSILDQKDYQNIRKWDQLSTENKNYFLINDILNYSSIIDDISNEQTSYQNSEKISNNVSPKFIFQRPYHFSLFEVNRAIYRYKNENPINGDLVFIVELLLTIYLKISKENHGLFAPSEENKKIQDYTLLVGADLFGINSKVYTKFSKLFIKPYNDFLSYLSNDLETEYDVSSLFIGNILSTKSVYSTYRINDNYYYYDCLSYHIVNEDIEDGRINSYPFSPFTVLFNENYTRHRDLLDNYWQIKEIVNFDYFDSIKKRPLFIEFTSIYDRIFNLSKKYKKRISYSPSMTYSLIPEIVGELTRLRNNNTERFDFYFERIFNGDTSTENPYNGGEKEQRINRIKNYFHDAMYDLKSITTIKRQINRYFFNDTKYSLKQYLSDSHLFEMREIFERFAYEYKQKEQLFEKQFEVYSFLMETFGMEIQDFIGRYVE